jgi:UDP-N-acetylmuramoylalanine--D-glutamate ligase
MQQTATSPRSVIVGLGRTGVSCARHLAARGHRLIVTDSRSSPPGLPELQRLVPEASTVLGGFDPAVLEGADQIVVSPGVSLREPFLQQAAARGLDLIGDIELFAREAGGRVIGITGTNGKSTVTTLVGEMAKAAGILVRVGGNLGEPALDLLAGPPAAMYVLELSSYQLETTYSLQLEAAAILNVTPDHLDRYRDVAEYAAAKARIFERCLTAIVNLDDALVCRMTRPGQPRLGFSLSRADADFRVLARDGRDWLAAGTEALMPVDALRLPGRHNAANALAALAVGTACGMPRAAMTSVLTRFEGLPHRSQLVAEAHGVRWIDDSKGTNVGATQAAIAGLPGPLVLIAGGDGKGQDFRPLAEACRGKVRDALLIGRDARVLGAAIAGSCAVHYANSMEAAVASAARLAQPGDIVLLSPACASFDMFRDYAHRGDVFAAAARRRAQ